MSSIDTSDNRNEGLHTDRESGAGNHPPMREDERSGRAGIAVPLDTSQSSFPPIPPSLYLAIDPPCPPMSHPHGTRFDCEALSVPTDLLYQLVTISCQLPRSLVFRFFTLFLTNVLSIGCSGTYRVTFITDSKNRAEWKYVPRYRYSLSYLTFG